MNIHTEQIIEKPDLKGEYVVDSFLKEIKKLIFNEDYLQNLLDNNSSILEIIDKINTKKECLKKYLSLNELSKIFIIQEQKIIKRLISGGSVFWSKPKKYNQQNNEYQIILLKETGLKTGLGYKKQNGKIITNIGITDAKINALLFKIQKILDRYRYFYSKPLFFIKKKEDERYEIKFKRESENKFTTMNSTNLNKLLRTENNSFKKLTKKLEEKKNVVSPLSSLIKPIKTLSPSKIYNVEVNQDIKNEYVTDFFYECLGKSNFQKNESILFDNLFNMIKIGLYDIVNTNNAKNKNVLKCLVRIPVLLLINKKIDNLFVKVLKNVIQLYYKKITEKNIDFNFLDTQQKLTIPTSLNTSATSQVISIFPENTFYSVNNRNIEKNSVQQNYLFLLNKFLKFYLFKVINPFLNRVILLDVVHNSTESFACFQRRLMYKMNKLFYKYLFLHTNKLSTESDYYTKKDPLFHTAKKISTNSTNSTNLTNRKNIENNEYTINNALTRRTINISEENIAKMKVETKDDIDTFLKIMKYLDKSSNDQISLLEKFFKLVQIITDRPRSSLSREGQKPVFRLFIKYSDNYGFIIFIQFYRKNESQIMRSSYNFYNLTSFAPFLNEVLEGKSFDNLYRYVKSNHLPPDDISSYFRDNLETPEGKKQNKLNHESYPGYDLKKNENIQSNTIFGNIYDFIKFMKNDERTIINFRNYLYLISYYLYVDKNIKK